MSQSSSGRVRLIELSHCSVEKNWRLSRYLIPPPFAHQVLGVLRGRTKQNESFDLDAIESDQKSRQQLFRALWAAANNASGWGGFSTASHAEEYPATVESRGFFHSKVVGLSDGRRYCGIYLFDIASLTKPEPEYAYGSTVTFGVWRPFRMERGKVEPGAWDVYLVNVQGVDSVQIKPSCGQSPSAHLSSAHLSCDPIYTWRSAEYDVKSRPWYQGAGELSPDAASPVPSKPYKDPVTGEPIWSALARLRTGIVKSSGKGTSQRSNSLVVVLGSWPVRPAKQQTATPQKGKRKE